MHYIQVKNVMEEPKTKNAEAEENLRKAESIFVVHLKILIHKTSADEKVPQLEICLRNTKK